MPGVDQQVPAPDISYPGSNLARLKVYPIDALSFQGVRNVHVGIIHVNQLDRNSGGEITTRIDFRDGEFNDRLLIGSVISERDGPH